MTKSLNESQSSKNSSRQTGGRATRPRNRRRILITGIWTATAAAILSVAALWIGGRAETINTELDAAAQLVPQLKNQVAGNNAQQAGASVNRLRIHTAAARNAAEDPLWTLASAVPFLGPNFDAVSEIARTADDVATLGAAPLVKVFDSLNWDILLPTVSGTDLEPLKKAAPSAASAAHAVRISVERLERIETSRLLPEVADPLIRAKEELRSVTDTLDASADAALIIPDMLGAEGGRNYLLMIQNNAESRASGGIPGALAVVKLEDGKLTLGAQTTAGEIGTFSPSLPVDTQQQQIYTARLGKYMQDVNLTPDFPTAASSAVAMWEKKTGNSLDGVLSIDPVALSYILAATGPVEIADSDWSLANSGLPSELNAKNVVSTLLSDVYAKIERPELQDVYFAGVAQKIFAELALGNADAKRLIVGITQATSEGRVRVWSATSDEQKVIAKYPLGGSIAGESVGPAEFGVYFNDGTGAKMDYYVKRTVQLVKECPVDGYEQTSVRITSTNSAPLDAGTSLPAYVTGNGAFGVPPGSVQTNIVAYGPAQAHVETAELDGQRTGFAPYFHGDRPVGVLAVLLAPGESKTVDITFGKIPQQSEPNVVVTPTVQPVKDVTLPTENAVCS
ncbi:uncharacterized protein DUF4012 [Arthrobacter sp. SLBN-100]|uniref:DUF4012 domain-containing protein n=1 Tax=Arthrobacter sp. SLBN-100 TaxID=2768450 RepID=UPI001153E201|nr:DUF4012 domain-containing protein [Arthrobacter sp. SLBN-100]TQJ67732.1 uncharacterized protein DUF4012 [Arthrobacter sp. SLBN-100]